MEVRVQTNPNTNPHVALVRAAEALEHEMERLEFAFDKAMTEYTSIFQISIKSTNCCAFVLKKHQCNCFLLLIGKCFSKIVFHYFDFDFIFL